MTPYCLVSSSSSARMAPHVSSSSSSRCRTLQLGQRPIQYTPAARARQLVQLHAIEEKRDTAGSETTSSPDMLSNEQLQKLAELRRQRGNAPQTSSNIVQGAFEEAQLISWPTPGKALLDTVLVLAIVAVTGTLLFGLNVLLADTSVWWYSH